MNIKHYRLSEPLRGWPPTLRNESGVYELVATQGDGNLLPLCRVGGSDSSGLLYIGQTRHLRSRLTAIRGTLCEGRLPGPMPAMTYLASNVFSDRV